MRNRHLVSVVLSICMLVPIASTLVGCDDKKQTLDPPVITAIYQDYLGSVCVKHNALQTEYNPEFSVDGTNWYSTQMVDSETVSTIRYDSLTDKFTYMGEGGEEIEYTGTTVEIGIREGETQDTYATKASNRLTLTLKKPVLTPPNITVVTDILGTQKQFPENTSTTAMYIAFSNNTATNQYTFAKLQQASSTPIDMGGTIYYDYEYVADNNIAGKLQYCLLGSTYSDSNSINMQSAEVMALQYSDCTTSFTVDDSWFVHASTTPGVNSQEAWMLIRYKETDSKLASSFAIVRITKQIV